MGALQSAGPAAGMVRDFDEVETIVGEHVTANLDHRSLNEILPNPTAELIALWIWDALAPHLPELEEVVLWETQTACAVVRRDDARAR